MDTLCRNLDTGKTVTLNIVKNGIYALQAQANNGRFTCCSVPYQIVSMEGDK